MTNTQSEGWGRPLFLSICGALLLALATLFVVQGALRSIVGRMDADGAAWFVVVLLTTMCLSAASGAFLIGVFAVMMIERSQLRAHRARDVVDAPAPMLPEPAPFVTIRNGPNQTQMVLREQIERDALSVLRKMYPTKPPRQDTIMQLFPHMRSHGYVSSVLDYLAEQGVCTAGSAGTPREWIANQP